MNDVLSNDAASTHVATILERDSSAAPAASGAQSGDVYTATTQYASALEAGVAQLRDEGWSKEQLAAEQRDMPELFRDFGISPHDARSLHGDFVQYRLNPADNGQVKEWSREARKQLRERYGNDADSRLAAAKEYLASKPSLKKMLAETGLGSKPEVVLMFAARAHLLRGGK